MRLENNLHQGKGKDGDKSAMAYFKVFLCSSPKLTDETCKTLISTADLQVRAEYLRSISSEITFSVVETEVDK
jgi:hypothetical protein